MASNLARESGVRGSVGGLLALALLVALAAIFAPNTASAQQQDWELQNGTTTIVFQSTENLTQEIGAFGSLRYYRGIYPDRSENVGSITPSPNSNVPLSTAFTAQNCTTTNFSATCGGDTIYGYGDGDYWVEYSFILENETATTTLYWIGYNRTGTSVTISGNAPIPSGGNQNRYMVINQPIPYGTTTPTTTVPINIQFFSQAGFDYLVLPPQRYGYEIYDAVTNELLYTSSSTLPANTSFNVTVSTTTVQTIGSKILRAYIRNASTSIDLTPPVETFYNVATNTYLAATGLENPRANAGGLTQNDCAVFDIGCQFQRALVFLFVPSASLTPFSDLWTTLINVPPFGYVSVTIRQLQGLNASTTPAWTMPQVPFADAIFTPLRTAFAAILWGIFAVAFYRRLKTIEL